MIKIQKSSIKASNLVSSSSRYISSSVLYYGENKFVTFETYKRKNYIKTGTEKIMVITKGVEYRPDLVSFDYYGFSDVWWRILEANNMRDIFDFTVGKTIILPENI